MSQISRAGRGAAVALVRAYQLTLSPWFGGACRFTPSCSHYAIEAIERVPGLKEKAGEALAALRGKLAEHHDYVREYGEDMPEVRDWVWTDM